MRRDAVRDGATIDDAMLYDAMMVLQCGYDVAATCYLAFSTAAEPCRPVFRVLRTPSMSCAQCSVILLRAAPFSSPGTRKAGDGSSWGKDRSARRLYLHSTPCSTAEHQLHQQHRCVCGALTWCLLPKVEFSPSSRNRPAWLGHLTFISTQVPRQNKAGRPFFVW